MAADPSIFSGFSASLGTLFSQQPQPLSMPMVAHPPWPWASLASSSRLLWGKLEGGGGVLMDAQHSSLSACPQLPAFQGVSVLVGGDGAQCLSKKGNSTKSKLPGSVFHPLPGGGREWQRVAPAAKRFAVLVPCASIPALPAALV
jgi:hypothetical protein